MPNFPPLNIPTGFSETAKKAQIRTEMGNGTVISRPKYTRGRLAFSLSWKNLPDSQYESLKTFFYTYQATLFNFTHPTTGVIYSVRFTEDTLGTFSWSKPGYKSGEINLEEL